MNNTIIYLTGHAGVGKLTVAQAIAESTGARIVDNHAVNNPIFRLIRLYRNEPLPDAVWDRVEEVRAAVLETIATLSPADWSFVFTHVALDHPDDIAVYHAIRRTAERRDARFLPVRLTCDLDELIRRIAMPERRALLKDISPANAREDYQKPLLALDEPDAVDLDITRIDPTEAANRIVAAAER
ncbi:AAA family ATPase [Bauldia sp.]|uniref:AAA family ATPase n=1 Tax=Bauldia sp. TaxID=2575872 RepID=UPI003BABB876